MNQHPPVASFAFPNEHMSVGFKAEQGNYPAESIRLSAIDTAVNSVLRAGEGVRRQNMATYATHASLAQERERIEQMNANNNKQRANLRAIITPQPTPVTPVEKLAMMDTYGGNDMDLHNTQFDDTRANQVYVEAVQSGMLDEVPASLADEPMFYEDLARATESAAASVPVEPEAVYTQETVPEPVREMTEQEQLLAEIRAKIDQQYMPAEQAYNQPPMQLGGQEHYALGA